jgi:hypothetical protein
MRRRYASLSSYPAMDGRWTDGDRSELRLPSLRLTFGALRSLIGFARSLDESTRRTPFKDIADFREVRSSKSLAGALAAGTVTSAADAHEIAVSRDRHC